MKRKIYVISFILSIFSIVLTVLIFTTISATSLFNGLQYWERNKTISSYIFDPSVDKINPVKFHSVLNEVAKENNLIIVKIKYGETEEFSNSASIFSTDNNSYFKDHVMLVNGYVNLSDSKNVYTFSSKDKRQRIVGFLGDSISLTSIVNDERNSGFYNFVNLKGDFQKNVSAFEKNIKQKFSDFKMVFQYSTNKINEKFSLITFDQLIFYKKFKMTIPFLSAILLCLALFSESKKISILKIEGFTNKQIYWRIFLKPYLVSSLFLMFIFLLFSTIYYLGNFITVKYLTIVAFTQFFQVHIITLFYSLLLWGIINVIAPKTYLKGKNNLFEAFSSLLLLKCLVVLISLPLLLPGLKNFYQMIHMMSRYNHVNEVIKDWYAVDTEIQTQYQKDIATKRYISIQERLKKDNELTSYSSGYYWDSNGVDYSKKIYFFDDVQIKKQNLVKGQFKEDEIYIFYRKGYQYDKAFYQEIAQDFLTNKTPVNVVEYEQKVFQNFIKELMFADEIDYKAPILYIPVEDRFKGQIAQSSFKYNGNIKKAQDYLDQVFMDAGYGHVFSIKSYQNMYEHFYNENLKEYLHSVTLFVVVVVSCYLISSLLIDIDIANNYKKYYISMVEGLAIVPVFLYIIKMSFVTFLAIFIYSFLRFKQLDLKTIISWFGFYFLFEFILYIKFHFKFKKARGTYGHRD